MNEATELADMVAMTEHHDLDTVFVYRDGTLTVDHSAYAPEWPDGGMIDVMCTIDGWEYLNGWTRQHGYRGAVMHDSELFHVAMMQDLIGRYDAEPFRFALVPVRWDMHPDENEFDDDLEGWAVAHQPIK